MLTDRAATLLMLFFSAFAHAQAPEPATVRVGILTLFHPRTLILTASQPTLVHLDSTTFILPPDQTLTLRSSPEGLLSAVPDASPISGRTLTIPDTTFTLSVPDKLTRTYRGALTLTARSDALFPVITIDTETAVASIVAAESPRHAPIEALKAQAVAARSYLLANRPAHPAFDTCDTTHCQFLRSPPPPSSPAAIAARATRHLVLTWRSSASVSASIVPTMYSRSCGGQTRPHPTTPGAYPFYAVPCDFCARHPESFNPHSPGHGVGLCQLGADDLARRGETFSRILAHFYPNTTLSQLP